MYVITRLLAMPRFLPCLLLATAFFLPACRSTPAPEVVRTDPADVPIPDLDPEGPDPATIVSDVGTIRYQDLEGGFYGLETDDGDRYNPLNLDARFRQDGLRVRFRAVKQDEVATIQMWGTPVRILEMLPLDE